MKKNYTLFLTIFGLACLFGPSLALGVWGLENVKEQAGEKALSLLVADTSGIDWKTVPEEKFKGVKLLCQKEGCKTNLSSAVLEDFVSFVVDNADKGQAWALPVTNGVYGAMFMAVLTNSFEDRKLFSSPILPDHAVYPTLRFSEELDSKARKIHEGMFKAPKGLLNWDSCRMVDYTAPNDTTGACYSYTNTRIFVQGVVGGRRVLFTGALMDGESSISKKGAPVTQDTSNLFFYSNEHGLNLPGASWMDTRMNTYRAFTLSVETGSNIFAFAAFSWLKAGWKGVNIIRTHHVYAVMLGILRELSCYQPGGSMTTEKLLGAIAESDALPKEAVEKEFSRYAAFCQGKAGKSLMGLKMGEFQRIYDKKALDDMPLKFKRAIVLQEKVRQLKGCPTWSAEQAEEKKKSDK